MEREGERGGMKGREGEGEKVVGCIRERERGNDREGERMEGGLRERE